MADISKLREDAFKAWRAHRDDNCTITDAVDFRIAFYDGFDAASDVAAQADDGVVWEYQTARGEWVETFYPLLRELRGHPVRAIRVVATTAAKPENE